jgi:uncharacterized protein (DUF488 family)
MTAAPSGTIFTIGHSTRSLADFTAILKAYEIERLVDIRTVPRSRTNPQFNRDTLPEALAQAGMEYEHVPALGGLRHARPESINTGWRNLSFRGYADYMACAEFHEGLDHLIELARIHRSAIMCAEAVPWRCHRSLVADVLLIRGFNVNHIMSAAKANPHVMTRFAIVKNGEVCYPVTPAHS